MFCSTHALGQLLQTHHAIPGEIVEGTSQGVGIEPSPHARFNMVMVSIVAALNYNQRLRYDRPLRHAEMMPRLITQCPL